MSKYVEISLFNVQLIKHNTHNCYITVLCYLYYYYFSRSMWHCSYTQSLSGCGQHQQRHQDVQQ